MISKLEDLCGAKAKAVGQLGSDLIALKTHLVSVTTTIVLTVDLFRHLVKTGMVPDAVMNELIQKIATEDFQNSRDLIIRLSLPGPYNGLEDRVRVSKTFASLK